MTGQVALDVATLSAAAATASASRPRGRSSPASAAPATRRRFDLRSCPTASSELGWTLYLGGERLWSAVPEGLFNIAANAALVAVVCAPAGRPPGGSGSPVRPVACSGPDGSEGRSDRRSARLRLRGATHASGGHRLADVEPERHRGGYLVPAPRRSILVGRLRPPRDDPPLVAFGILGVAASPAILIRKAIPVTARPGPRSPPSYRRPRHSCRTMRWCGGRCRSC